MSVRVHSSKRKRETERENGEKGNKVQSPNVQLLKEKSINRDLSPTTGQWAQELAVCSQRHPAHSTLGRIRPAGPRLEINRQHSYSGVELVGHAGG